MRSPKITGIFPHSREVQDTISKTDAPWFLCWQDKAKVGMLGALLLAVDWFSYFEELDVCGVEDIR